MIELCVLGQRGVKWLKQPMKAAAGRLLGAGSPLPSSEKERREPGAPRGEVEVFKLHPTHALDSIAP